jgi:thiamine-monophosphate kinase
MNEPRFVAALQKKFPFRRGAGIGDDASIVRCGKTFQLISTDLLIEDIHFRFRDLSPAQLAEKALAVNLSDIAAMGGRAQYFYLGLGFPDGLPGGYLGAFFSGLSRAARNWRLELAGGDYSRSAKMVIAITIVGTAARPVRRSGARPGDWIGITGPTGASALGLELLLAGKKSSPFIRCHQHPLPQVEKGLLLARFAHAMIDLSDGLLLDLSRVLRASAVGAELDYEKLPVSPAFRLACRRNGLDEKELVLAGGEDYELLFTIAPEGERRLRRLGMSYHLIGRVTAGRRLLLREGGRRLRVARFGFDHFAAPEDPRRGDPEDPRRGGPEDPRRGKRARAVPG